MIRHLVGDVREQLPTLPAGIAQTCVTSPPYWGLRDYGVAGQIGLEESPEAYIAELVNVFRDVRRTLASDGTLWLNLGDSYTDGGRGDDIGSTLEGTRRNQRESRRSRVREGRRPFGLGRKQLVGMPWRVAFALQADGWILRSDIVWHKPNPMPESVNDRPTKAHEYVFLFAKSTRYFYDAAAIKEPVSGTAHARGVSGIGPKAVGVNSRENVDRVPRRRVKQNESMQSAIRGLVTERNKRSVWTVGSEPYRGAHFATFPPSLIEPCILAGSRPNDTVLDPFGGAGTTGLVADRLGRDAILIELNPAYAQLSRDRITGDAPLLAEVGS
jgi:DNA modification methylase